MRTRQWGGQTNQPLQNRLSASIATAIQTIHIRPQNRMSSSLDLVNKPLDAHGKLRPQCPHTVTNSWTCFEQLGHAFIRGRPTIPLERRGDNDRRVTSVIQFAIAGKSAQAVDSDQAHQHVMFERLREHVTRACAAMHRPHDPAQQSQTPSCRDRARSARLQDQQLAATRSGTIERRRPSRSWVSNCGREYLGPRRFER